MTVAARTPVDSAVLECLRTNLPAAVLVGDGEWPEGVPDTPERDLAAPFVILYPVEGGNFEGPPFVAPEADAQLLYQTATHHRSRRHCGDGADRVRWVLTGRTGTGAFVYPMPIAAQPSHLAAAGLRVDVMMRESAGSAGAPERGDTLWRADDLWIVTVTTHPA